MKNYLLVFSHDWEVGQKDGSKAQSTDLTHAATAVVAGGVQRSSST
jgi:hypothetical protein